MKSSPSARNWLQNLLCQLAAHAIDDTQRMVTHRDAAIHALRVRMKKLQALLLLAVDKPEGTDIEPLLNHVRAIKNGFSGTRDAHVVERVATKIAKARLPLSPFIQHLTWTTEHAQKETASLLEEMKSLKLPRITWKEIANRHVASYRRVRKAMKHCAGSHDAEAFHQWRKRVKVHYFQSLALHRHRQGAKRIHAAARLASKLGHEHDITLVESRLDEARRGQQWKKRLEHKRHKLHTKLLSEGRRAFDASPKCIAKNLLHKATS